MTQGNSRPNESEITYETINQSNGMQQVHLFSV